MDDVIDSVKRGGTIAEPLAQASIFPAMVSQMVAVGEETGELDCDARAGRRLLRGTGRGLGQGADLDPRADHDHRHRRDGRVHRDLDVPAAVQGLQPHREYTPGSAGENRSRAAAVSGHPLGSAARSQDHAPSCPPARVADRERRLAGSSSSSSSPTSSRAPAAQRAHVGLGPPAARSGHDRLQLGARGQQLVGEPGLARARAHERLGERDQRRVVGLRRRRPRGRWRRRPAGARRPARMASSSSSPRRPPAAAAEAADPPERPPASRGCAGRARPASASLSTPWTGRSWRSAVRSRQCTSSRATAAAGALEAADPRQALEDRRRGRARRSSARAPRTPRSAHSRPPELLQAAARARLGELEQVHDVLARVGELLGARAGGCPSA